MIKRLSIKELQLGMYVCGIEKAGSNDPEFFMNNILIRTEKDLADFARSNHKSVYVELPDPPAAAVQTIEEKEEPDQFDSFQSIDPDGPEQEPEPLAGPSEDEEYRLSDEASPDLMGLFEPFNDMEPEASPAEEEVSGAGMPETPYELDEAGPFELEAQEETPVREIDDEVGEVPEETEPATEEAEAVSGYYVMETPEAPEETDTTAEPEVMEELEDTEPEAVAEPEVIEEPEVIAEEASLEEMGEAMEEEAEEAAADEVEEPEAILQETDEDEASDISEALDIIEEAVAEDEPVTEESAAEEETCSSEEQEECVIEVAAPSAQEPVEAEAQEQEIRDTVSFDEELTVARKIRGETESLVRDFMGRVKIDGEIMPERINETVGRMVESVFKNQDALASLSRLKTRDDYTYGHCVNVCILSLAIGRHMSLSEGQLNELGVGALLHDIGKMLIPEEILKKPGQLTSAEFGEMQKHTSLGGEILYKTRAITDASRTVPMHHHEKYDGSGYVEGISGQDIHLFARIAAVADVYDAMTSDRVYQKGMSADVALRRMYQFKGVNFEPVLVDRLIKCLGIYPIGTLVELNTGEVAVVSMPNHTDPLKPKVLMLYDRVKKRLPGPVDIDLGSDQERWISASRDAGPLTGLIEKLIA